MYIPISYIREDKNLLYSNFGIIDGRLIMFNDEGAVFAVTWDDETIEKDKDRLCSNKTPYPFSVLDDFLKTSGTLDKLTRQNQNMTITGENIKIQLAESFYFKIPIKNSIDKELINSVKGVSALYDDWEANGVSIKFTAYKHYIMDKCFRKDTIVQLKYEHSHLIIENEYFEFVLGENIYKTEPGVPISTTLIYGNIKTFFKYAGLYSMTVHFQMLGDGDNFSPIMLMITNKGTCKEQIIKSLVIAPYAANVVENGIDEVSGPTDISASADIGVDPSGSSSVIGMGVEASLVKESEDVGGPVRVIPPILTGSPPDGVKVSFDSETGIVIWEPEVVDDTG